MTFFMIHLAIWFIVVKMRRYQEEKVMRDKNERKGERKKGELCHQKVCELS